MGKNKVHRFRKDTVGRKCEVTGHSAPSQETKQKGTVAKPKHVPNGSHPPPPQCSRTSQQDRQLMFTSWPTDVITSDTLLPPWTELFHPASPYLMH